MTEIKIILLTYAHGGSLGKSYQEIAAICGVDRRTAMRAVDTLSKPSGARPVILEIRQVKQPGKYRQNFLTLKDYSTGVKPRGVWTIEEIMTSYQDNLRVIQRDFQLISRNMEKAGTRPLQYHEIGDAEIAGEIQKIFAWLQKSNAKVYSLDKFIFNWIVRSMSVQEKTNDVRDVPEGVSYAD